MGGKVGSMKTCTALVLACYTTAWAGRPTSGVVYSFSKPNFTFPSAGERDAYFSQELYNNTIITGVKVWQDHVFVSLPRWKGNVPATLAKVLETPDGPLLEPFPSWSANKEGDPDALQNVLGFEIDTCDRIWVLDQGKVAGQAALPGAIKLVVYDLASRRELWRTTFAENVASARDSFLNDLVIDLHNQFVYISDSGLSVDSAQGVRAGLIAVDMQTRKASRVLDGTQSASVQPEAGHRIFINGALVVGAPNEPMMTGVNGIALSPDGQTLYYCALSSYRIFSASTQAIRCVARGECTTQTVLQSISDLGQRNYSSDGLSVDNQGRLYITSLERSSIERVDNPGAGVQASTTIKRDAGLLVWPDTLGWDNSGGLWFVSNTLNKFVTSTLDYSQTNFRVWRWQVGGQSYQAEVSKAACSGPPNTSPPKKAGPPASVVVLICLLVATAIAIGAGTCWRRHKARREAAEFDGYEAMDLGRPQERMF